MNRDPGCLGAIYALVLMGGIMGMIGAGLYRLAISFDDEIKIGVLIIASIVIGAAILYGIDSYVDRKGQYKNKLDSEYKNKCSNLKEIYEQKDKEIAHAKDLLKERESDILRTLKDKSPFNLSSLMYADVKMYIFDKTIQYLNTKTHPAKTSAETVRLMKKEAREHARLYREMEYKFQILLNVFPELKSYIDDTSGDALSSLTDSTLDDVVSNYDKVRDYLSDEEYERLSLVERNQLALDRYNARPKSNWTIGVEYEMYIEYWFREKKKCKTIPHGSLNGLADLGRDIIAEEDKDGTHITYIIQCKRYSANKQIHENTICQLYGTAIEYELSHNNLFGIIIPILYSTTDLSPMAAKFAERLGVKTYKTPMREYPQIKCNIGQDGEKIYHLPFDQQYYKVKIDKAGEFYAWTAKEAEDAGFRRAKKYIFNE